MPPTVPVVQFSVAKTMFATLAIAAGLAQAAAIDDDYLLTNRGIGFCLAMLTIVLGGGLLQQVIWPPTSNSLPGPRLARRAYLALIAIGMTVAVHQTNLGPSPPRSPYVEPTPSGFAVYEAIPLWYLTLFLAAMTQPWMTARQKPNRGRLCITLGQVISVITALGILLACVLLARDEMLVTFLIDNAIQGHVVAMQQPAAVGSEHFVEYFGRSPQLLRQFVDWQLVSWPLLLGALMIALAHGRSKRPLVWAAIVMLALPAMANAYRLASGGAVAIAPLMMQDYWLNASSHQWMVYFAMVLLGLYIATRAQTTQRHDLANKLVSPTVTQRYASDSLFVGPALVVTGACQVHQIYNDLTIGLYTANSRYAFTVTELFWAVAWELTAAEYLIGFMPLPLGILLLYRRWRYRNDCTSRWPEFDSVDVWYVPTITAMLILTVVLAIPFGFAMHYVDF